MIAKTFFVSIYYCFRVIAKKSKEKWRPVSGFRVLPVMQHKIGAQHQNPRIFVSLGAKNLVSNV